MGWRARTGNCQRNRAQQPCATTRRIWFVALMDHVAGQRLAGACDMQHGKFVALCRTKQDENRSFRSGGRPTDGNPSEGTQARRHEGTEWRRESGAGNSPSGRSWGDVPDGNECSCCDGTIKEVRPRMARISPIRRRVFSSNPLSIVVCKCGLRMLVFSAGSVASVFSVVAFGGQQRGDPAFPRHVLRRDLVRDNSSHTPGGM